VKRYSRVIRIGQPLSRGTFLRLLISPNVACLDKKERARHERGNMLKSYPTRYPISRAGTSSTGTRVIRLTVNQEAVLQEQFNRWPRAPYTADVILLAAETGLSEADVEVWYGIRLAQWRKEQGLGGSILGLH